MTRAPVRTESAIFKAADELFPASFHAEGLSKVQDALADMEDLVADWSYDSSEFEDSAELDEFSSVEETAAAGIQIIVTESPSVDTEELDCNFGKDSKTIQGPFNSLCFALSGLDYLQVPEGIAPAPSADADWDFTSVPLRRRGNVNTASGISGSLFLPTGDATSIIPLTTATPRLDVEMAHSSPVEEVTLPEYIEFEDQDSSVEDSEGPRTPEIDTDDQLYFSDSPIIVTRSPTLDFKELDVNFGEKKIPSTFNPLYFAFSETEFLQAPKGIAPTPTVEPDWDFTYMSRRRQASNVHGQLSGSLFIPQCTPSGNVRFLTTTIVSSQPSSL